ncbi:MAG: substrate-binding domain-containing protein [Alphaproteobacteria bacterium]|nr:substrate-binding domain-containing protein [Alphaproteobacteria bacterium]
MIKSHRVLCLALALLGFALPARADLLVLTPGFIYNAGLLDLAADFTKQTGIKVTVRSTGMAAIISQVKTASPAADVVIVPMEPFDLMGNLALDKAIKRDTFTPLGRVEIGLAVKAGAPHPDIATVEKLIAVLKTGTVMYSNPAGGSMEAGIIDRLLKRPEFAGVRGRISTNGEGGQALARGEGDMALQLICEVYNHPEISLAGVLPPELNAHMDGAAAVSARTTDEKNARAFVAFIARPETAPVWKAKGLNLF